MRRRVVAYYAIFVVYALGTVLAYSLVRILVCALLLSNVRAVWIASKWRSSGNVDVWQAALSESFGDYLSDLFPAMVWPKTRHIFYVFAVLEIAALASVLVRLWWR